MAYLLTVTSFSPFCYRQPQLQQGTHSRRSTHTMLINPVTNRTGKRPVLRNYSGGGMISSNKSCDLSIYAPAKQCLERIVFCRSDQVLISGFWIGPDIEDGWGFVEASLCRIY
ncbi:hypothetical protein ABFS83_14G189300 [Erythranthe nasuta]